MSSAVMSDTVGKQLFGASRAERPSKMVRAITDMMSRFPVRLTDRHSTSTPVRSCAQADPRDIVAALLKTPPPAGDKSTRRVERVRKRKGKKR